MCASHCLPARPEPDPRYHGNDVLALICEAWLNSRGDRHGEWRDMLGELAAQLQDGRTYARQLTELGTALSQAQAARVDRRHGLAAGDTSVRQPGSSIDTPCG